MISSLSLKNFQSHQDTQLEFHPGFNAIVGSTDSGKSAIYRSIFWPYSNKATNFISFWNRKTDGTPKEETSATLKMKDLTLTRIRSPEKNGYILNGDLKEAIGRGGPPETVSQALNLSDINFFSQHNPPFLLTESAGKVAEMLNELIHLDAIDDILTKFDVKKRSTKQKVEQDKSEYETANASLAKLFWIKNASDFVEEMDALNVEIGGNSAVLTQLGNQIDLSHKTNERLEANVKIFTKLNTTIEEVTSILKDLEDCVAELNNLSTIMASINSLDKNLTKLKALDITGELEYCDTIKNELETLTEEFESLTNYIEKYGQRCKSIKNMGEQSKSLLESLPTSCPTCGQSLDECEGEDE
jgi:exonuclease SbcC